MRFDYVTKRIIALAMAATLAAPLSYYPADGYQVKAAKKANVTVNNASQNTTSDILSNGLIAKAIEDEMDQDTSEVGEGSCINSVEINGKNAAVDLIAGQEATLVVSLTSDDDSEVYAMAYADVNANEDNNTTQQVDLKFSVSKMPEYYKIHANLLSKKMGVSISGEYVDSSHVKALQELEKSTTDDYDEKLVLNLDDNKEDNFVVYGEGVIRLKSDGTTNELVTSEGATDTFTIKNISKDVKNLKKGDIISLDKDTENLIAAKKIVSISFSGNDAKLKVSDDLEIGDVYDYVSIDTDLMQDFSTDDEKISGLSAKASSSISGGGLEHEKTMNFSLKNDTVTNDKEEPFELGSDLTVTSTVKTKVTFEAKYKVAVKLDFKYAKKSNASTLKIILNSTFSNLYFKSSKASTVRFEFPEITVIKMAKDNIEKHDPFYSSFYKGSFKVKPVFKIRASEDGTVITGSDLKINQTMIYDDGFHRSHDFEMCNDIRTKGDVHIIYKPNPTVSGLLPGSTNVNTQTDIYVTCDSKIRDHLCNQNKLCCYSGKIQYKMDGNLTATCTKNGTYNIASNHHYAFTSDKKVEKYPWYYNFDEKKGGLSVCPHNSEGTLYTLKITAYYGKKGNNLCQCATIKVTDSKGKLEDKEVSTSIQGTAKVYLPKGQYTLSIDDGIYKTSDPVSVVIKKDCEQIIFATALKEPTAEIDVKEKVAINDKNFPDPVFQEFVKQYDTDKDDKLSEKERNAVTSISVTNKKIQKLDGIFVFEKLEKLNCSRNEIKTLDLKNCNSLTKLYCDHNSITKLNVTPCSKLQTLSCKSNDLTTLNTEGLKNLYEVYCSYNSFKETIDVSTNTALQIFSCEDNGKKEDGSGKVLKFKLMVDPNNMPTAISAGSPVSFTLVDLSGAAIKKDSATSDATTENGTTTESEVGTLSFKKFATTKVSTESFKDLKANSEYTFIVFNKDFKYGEDKITGDKIVFIQGVRTDEKGSASVNYAALSDAGEKVLVPCYGIDVSDLDCDVQEYEYDGSYRNPDVTVKYGDYTLQLGEDFVFEEGSAARDAGSYKVALCGKNEFVGTKTIDYSILGKTSANTDSSITEVKSIDVKASKTIVAEGDKITMSAQVAPSNSTDKTIIWSVNDTELATIDQNGNLEILEGASGKEIVVTANAYDGSGVYKEVRLTVQKSGVKSIKLKAKKKVKAGKSVKVTATVTTVGKGVSKKLKWSVSNKKYATVTSSGVVKTKKAGKGKKVKVTATSADGTKKASVTIKITK